MQIGSGDRSEKIRTYNFPQNRVTDHRIGFTLYKLESIMEGELGEVVEALISGIEASGEVYGSPDEASTAEVDRLVKERAIRA